MLVLVLECQHADTTGNPSPCHPAVKVGAETQPEGVTSEFILAPMLIVRALHLS